MTNDNYTDTDATANPDGDEWNDPPLDEESPISSLAPIGFIITLIGLAAFFIMIGYVLAGGAPTWMAAAPITIVLFGFVLVGAGTDPSEVGDGQGGA